MTGNGFILVTDDDLAREFATRYSNELRFQVWTSGNRRSARWTVWYQGCWSPRGTADPKQLAMRRAREMCHAIFKRAEFYTHSNAQLERLRQRMGRASTIDAILRLASCDPRMMSMDDPKPKT